MMEECKKEKGEMKDAIEQLEEMSADEKERELYEIRERSRLTYNTEIYEARRKGLEDGKKIGEKRGEKREKENIAKKLLIKGMSIEEISEITQLTEQEIKTLK